MQIMDNDLPLSYWIRIAEKNGIARKTFHYRLKRHAPRAAATMPLHNKGKPADPNSARQVALNAGLHECSIVKYRDRRPGCTLSNQQIVKKLLAHHKQRENTLSKRAKAAGLPEHVLYHRLSSGWPIDKALKEPLMTRSEYSRLGGKARAQQKREARKNNALTQ